MTLNESVYRRTERGLGVGKVGSGESAETLRLLTARFKRMAASAAPEEDSWAGGRKARRRKRQGTRRGDTIGMTMESEKGRTLRSAAVVRVRAHLCCDMWIPVEWAGAVTLRGVGKQIGLRGTEEDRGRGAG